MDYQVEPQALKGHVILVTGAGAGIGKQAAMSYAEHGATVILLGKTVNKLEATFDEIVAAGFPEPAIVPLDLKGASKQNYLDMVDTIEQEYGRLDGILHNASLLGMIGPFEHIEEDSFDDLMQVNVKAELLMTQAALPLLRKAPQGRVVFTSSTVGHSGRALWGAYAISKFATEGMMQVLADEMSNTNVRINAINPGATRTNMRAQAYPAEDANRLKTPLELMPLYLYLMSAESQDINGQCIDAQPKAK
ncbi:3-oxoacyl-ACP reductase [Vibrio sp. qd031]|uniref:YciK family oxidoreductase n=1 Tax=Vibrio sp. qd031 TaxID=1603038 RepID=UPI000A0FADBE|nr:YciK family oxidoreductase [Vibrio sp. qd031]ORT49438.1 3-oxoacyl-ACP reductase [Vibrio sp. qd031]